MEFNYRRRLDTQKHYNYGHPTSSSSSSVNYSDQPMIHGLRDGRSVVPVREPAALMLVQPLRSYYQCDSEMRLHGGTGGYYDHRRDIREFEVVRVPFHRLPPSPEIKDMVPKPTGATESATRMHGEPFSSYDITNLMARDEIYHGGGYREFEAVPVPLHRLPLSPEIKEIVMLPKTTDATVSGSKRKAPSPYSSPSVVGSSGYCPKKKTDEWRCAVCDITATSEHGLNDHLAGKKHQAKVDSLKSNKTGGDIGLGVIKTSTEKQTFEVKSLKDNNSGGYDIGLGVAKNVSNDSKKERKVKMSDGGKIKKKYKFWCKMCQIGAYDEVVMRDHKKGKKHIKNRRMKVKARAQRKLSNDQGI